MCRPKIVSHVTGNAASDFLEQHGIKFSKVDLVAKTYSKDILIATYKDLFSTKSFRDAAVEEAKKVALEQQKKDEAAAAAAAAAAEPEPVVVVKEEKIYFKKDIIKKVPIARLIFFPRHAATRILNISLAEGERKRSDLESTFVNLFL